MKHFEVWLSVAFEENQAFPCLVYKGILKNTSKVKCLLWFWL